MALGLREDVSGISSGHVARHARCGAPPSKLCRRIAFAKDRPMTATRTETDTFGPIEVAADRYWGAQTQRSLQNFKIGWEKQPIPVIRALGVVKRAAAETNMALGHLDATIGAAIIAAA